MGRTWWQRVETPSLSYYVKRSGRLTMKQAFGSNHLSVAFTKEGSAETASETQLPDRPISEGPNWVTPEGLGLLKQQLQAAEDAYALAQEAEDINERRRLGAIPLRDLRYLMERVRTAQVKPAPPHPTRSPSVPP